MASESKGIVGIVGLGIMGGAIARNLQERGWRVTGFDTNKERRKEAIAAGIDFVADAAEVAKKAATILTILPRPDSLTTTVRQIADAKLPKRIIVELSTFSLDDKTAAEALAREAGHILLDCPMSGTGAQAKTRDLSIYASGDTGGIETVRPLLLDFSRAVTNLGAFGNGSRMKFVANLLVAIHNVASAEAFTLGMKAGLDPQQILELVKSGAGNSRVFELRGPMMAEGNYDEATMKISVWQKDMAVIRQFARELGCQVPMLDASAPIYSAAVEHGLGDKDTAAVCLILEEMAGIKRKPS
jgi:putative dehydrogenase